MQEPALLVRDVCVKYRIRHHDSERTIRSAIAHSLVPRRKGAGRRNWRQTFWALKDINLVVHPGEVVGIIGRNGSGKTTLLKTLAGIIGTDRGEIAVRGAVACLLSLGVGFNPNLTGRENIHLSASLIGIKSRRIDEIVDEIVEFSELGEFIAAPVQTYSKGMRVRLGFAIAIHVSPDILLLDEVLTAGDQAFREKAGNIIEHIRGRAQTVVIASHSMGLIRHVCNRAIWLATGEVRMDGDAESVCSAYLDEIKAHH